MAFTMPYCKNSHNNNAVLLRLLLLFCFLLPASNTLADGIYIRNANTSLTDNVYRLDAQIDYRLSKELLDALQNGVTLTLMVEVDIFRKQSYWLDSNLASLIQRYQLNYHALSQKFQLTNLNSGRVTSHVDLEDAIHIMGNLSGIPILDQDILQPNTTYYARLRAGLDTAKLPTPLLLLSYFMPGWQLRSEWYTWPIQD